MKLETGSLELLIGSWGYAHQLLAHPLSRVRKHPGFPGRGVVGRLAGCFPSVCFERA